jgi:hypothetical protein
MENITVIIFFLMVKEPFNVNIEIFIPYITNDETEIKYFFHQKPSSSWF